MSSDYFFQNLGADRLYSKASPFSLGASVHGEGAQASDFDALSIRAEANLEGAPESLGFDPEGIALSNLPPLHRGSGDEGRWPLPATLTT